MCKKRVVITGLGAVSPFGYGVAKLMAGLHANRSALVAIPEEGESGPTKYLVAGLVTEKREKSIARSARRTMSAMSIYAVHAAKEALAMAGFGAQLPRMGVAVGSTMGSPHVIQDFFANYLFEKDLESIRATTFFKVMGHSVAANLVQALGLTGRMLAPTCACASGLMGIGLGYEAIALGAETCMLCGGADEYHPLTTLTFERIGAASHMRDPSLASRPFDRKRDGVVCGEGAGMLVLESYESAHARGAEILAEIVAFAARSASTSIAHPAKEALQSCMQEALDLAKMTPKDIVYVNAHATATEFGDISEGTAIEELFAQQVPVSSLKGHLGHTMAASGALETIACLAMLKEQELCPTLNLQEPDERCGQLAFLLKRQKCSAGPIVKNSFALGGACTTIVIAPV